MPYVDREARHAMDHGRPPMTAGELNYAITLELIDFTFKERPFHEVGEAVVTFVNRTSKLMKDYWEAPWHQKRNYQLANDVLGASIGAAFEYTRRAHGKAEEDTINLASTLLADVTSEFYDEIVEPYEKTKIAENGDVYPA